MHAIVRSRDQLSTPSYRIQPLAETPASGIVALRRVCRGLLETFDKQDAPFNARQFEPVLRSFRPTISERAELLGAPLGKYTLVQNELLKVVLICWKRGEETNVHGHPAGGCLFTVLEGSLAENRYSPADPSETLSSHKYHAGALAYIDNTVAWHDVRNVSSAPAISLHAYTPGFRSVVIQ